MPANSAAYLTQLHNLIHDAFSLDDIRTLCLKLHVDFDDIPGRAKPAVIRELLLALGRAGRLPALIPLLQEERPRVAWPPVPDDFHLPASLLSGDPAVPANQYHIDGDMMQGDKISGDKIGRDKIIYNFYGDAPPAKPSESDVAALLPAYYQACVTRLSAPRYQLDSRFVRLTLLIDQGADAPGPRFTPDSQRQKYNSLAALLADVDEQAVVLLGAPGSGKTTLLRRLQLEHAQVQLEKPTGRIAFFVPLNSYRSPAPGAPPPDPYDWLAKEWRIRQPRLPDFQTFYEAGQMLLLLDGLNEMPHTDKADYRARIARWQAFWQRTRPYGNRIVFSCRSLDYSAPLSSEAAPVRQAQVEPLTDEQIREFLHVYLGDKSEEVWQTLRRNPQRLALFSAPFFLRLLTDQIEASGDMPAGQAALLTSFVRRALHREMDERRHALFDPGPLLSEDDCQQIRLNAWGNPFDLPGEGCLIPSLEELAYRMQDNRDSAEAALVRVKTGEAQNWLPSETAQDIIAAGFKLNVLDKDTKRKEIAFYHQLIQEYFAARVLARRPEPARLFVPWRAASGWRAIFPRADTVQPSLSKTVAGLEISEPLPRLPATGWEETTLLAAAMSRDQETFVRDLIAPNLPLAARCAAAAEVTVSPALTRRLQEELIARINDPQADLRARIAAAEALGELGDPRFERRSGPHGDYLLPPMVEIPGGRYPLGDDKSGYDDEKPAHTVELAPFALAVYPLTNAEYRLFMEAGGYEEERWWQTEAARAWLRGEGSNEGQKQAVRDAYGVLQAMPEENIRQAQVTPEQIDQWLWLKGLSQEVLEKQLEEWFPAGEAAPRQPELWEDSRFNHPAQPVVGITWYEARAYCAWLSAQTGEAYRLPTEAEWEAAARGQKGRVYPWGEQFDVARCNTFETHIRGTTPVGVFPGGRTPEGLADVSGNVWEWTSTIWGESLQKPEFAYPYEAADGREDLERTNVRRVARGGSWNGDQGNARAACRYISHPDDRGSGLGVRVAAARRSPSQ